MEALIIASLIAALLAGLAALFAPCCIGVLLPAYFASIFRQKRTVFLMTLVFFLGLLAVFLPIGLGLGFIGNIFKQYHNTIYVIGSLFLFALGCLLILGKQFSMPFHAKSPSKVTGGASVFVLGIFSGFATLCCAPVLAGALALSVLPGSVIWGGVYSIFYVLGMVLPLFIISYFVDKTKIMEKTAFLKKNVTYHLFGKTITVSVSNLASGIIFILMALLITYFVSTNRVASHSSTQISVNIFIAKLTDSLTLLVGRIPSWTGAGLLMLVFVLLAFAAYRKRAKSRGLK